jgi:hypothetical protein
VPNDIKSEEDAGDVDRVHAVSFAPPTAKARIAANVTYIILGTFVLLMSASVFCVLFSPRCASNHGMEVLQLLSQIFGPILGVILAFYFAADLKAQ